MFYSFHRETFYCLLFVCWYVQTMDLNYRVFNIFTSPPFSFFLPVKLLAKWFLGTFINQELGSSSNFTLKALFSAKIIRPEETRGHSLF